MCVCVYYLYKTITTVSVLNYKESQLINRFPPIDI